ncbi:MAG: hypothetical protein ACI8Q1_002651 [Parvicella sp.]|jgi:hypothetical protein
MKRFKKIGLYLLGFIVVSFLLMKITGTTVNDIGLKILSGVKWITGNSVNLEDIENSEKPVVDHSNWTELLKDYVTIEGVVNYKGFEADHFKLDEYLKLLSDNAPGINWSANDEKAFWINAYNAFTVKLILDHYPVNSIKDISEGMTMISSSWDLKFFTIGGVEFDLNTIEHEILRTKFPDYKVHFAVNCASKSCPRLRNEAYVGNRLSEQLENQAKYFINNSFKNKITSSSTQISSIFSWFSSDFTSEQTLVSILEKYHSEFNPNNSMEYLPYDWTLNE